MRLHNLEKPRQVGDQGYVVAVPSQRIALADIGFPAANTGPRST